MDPCLVLELVKILPGFAYEFLRVASFMLSPAVKLLTGDHCRIQTHIDCTMYTRIYQAALSLLARVRDKLLYYMYNR